MNTFTPLWNTVIESSLWDEPYFIRVLFMTMLACKDHDHVVRYNAYNLSKKGNMTEKEVIEGLRVLAAPDRLRKEKQLYDGRRIEKHPEGWLVLNGEFYKKKMSEEMKKARNRRAQAAWRARQEKGGSFEENHAVKTMENPAPLFTV